MTYFQVEGKTLHVGGVRPYYTAQFNLFEHIGVVSSLRQTGMGTFPGCNADLSPVLWDWLVVFAYIFISSKSSDCFTFITAKSSRATAKIFRLAEEHSVIGMFIITVSQRSQVPVNSKHP